MVFEEKKTSFPSFLAAADEHRVQDFSRAERANARRLPNPERGVHLSPIRAAAPNVRTVAWMGAGGLKHAPFITGML